jgi:hypothetical protein
MPKTTSVLVACCLLAGAALAQVTITEGDVPRTLGDSTRYKYVQSWATVDNGPAGGPHTWTFDTSTYIGYVLTQTIVDRASTPFAERFPDANLAAMEPRGAYTLYVYNRLDPDALQEHGFGAYFGTSGIARANVPPAMVLDLPATLGTSWQTAFTVTDTAGDTLHVAAETRRFNVDAWGTAVTPAGSFECLRENAVGVVVRTTYVGGNPVSVDTVPTRRYMWLARGVGMVAMTHSNEGDTSPDFTDADDYTVMVQTSAGAVTETGRSPLPARSAVSPNPCGRFATVSLGPPMAGPVRVELTDPAGRVWLKQAPPAAVLTVRLDLSRVPAGVYFCSVAAAGWSETHRLVRVR